MWADAEDAGEGPEEEAGRRAYRRGRRGAKWSAETSSEAGGRAKPSGGTECWVEKATWAGSLRQYGGQASSDRTGR